MNDQIISQIKNLLSPAARAYLQKIVDGKVPLKRTPGISPLPEGLDSTQVSMLHEIAQANEPGDLVISRIVNSGVLRTTGGGPTAPKSAEDLYNKLYDIVSGKTIGPSGPPDPARQVSSSRVPGEGSAQGRDVNLSRIGPQPTPGVEMSGQLYVELRNRVKPVYLLWMDGAEPTNMWTPDIDRMNTLLFDFANAELDDQTFINRLFRDPDSRETEAFVSRLRQQQREVQETGTSTYLPPAEPYSTSRVPGGGAPVPYAEQEMGGPPLTRDRFVPDELANQVLRFIDDDFQPWFILETNNLKDVVERYPGTPNIPAEDRELLVEARQILDQLAEQGPNRPIGDERDRLIADVFANLAPFIEAGQQYGEVYENKLAGLERVLAGARFVDPIADPLGREIAGPQGPGFGRGPVTAGPAVPPAPSVPPTDRGTITQPSVPPTDRATLGQTAQPAPSRPPTDRGTIEGVTPPAQLEAGGPATTMPETTAAVPTATTPRTPVAVSPTTTVAGPGGQWVYDPLTSQPVFLEEGESLPPRIDPATYRQPSDTTGDTTGGTTGDTTGGTTGDTTGDTTGGVPTYVPEAPAVPEEWEQAASEIYGAYYSIIKQNPEVAALIAEASANKWGPEKFDYALEQTEWWRTTSLAIREFDIEMERDPATVQARIDALAASLQQTALDLNIRLTGETLNRLSTDAIRQGWTEQQVTNALGTEAIKAGATGITGLRYGFYGNKINEIAGNYGVSISDTEFNELVNKFAVGQENEQSLTSSFQTRATALFPAISERLMAGETFRNIVEPYRSRASTILGRDFAATDFMDNDSFAQAVTYVGDDGKQRPMTYTEWGQYLRTNREFGYEFTDEAQSRAYMVANRIADLFGAI